MTMQHQAQHMVIQWPPPSIPELMQNNLNHTIRTARGGHEVCGAHAKKIYACECMSTTAGSRTSE